MRRTAVLALVALLAASAAAAPVRSGKVKVKRLPTQGPMFVPGVVLVKFRQTPAGAKVATAQDTAPVVPGLQLVGLVGSPAAEAIKIPRGPAAAAADPAPALPPTAIFKYRVVDGSRVPAKVAQLRAHPGEPAACGCHAASAAAAAAAAVCRVRATPPGPAPLLPLP